VKYRVKSRITMPGMLRALAKPKCEHCGGEGTESGVSVSWSGGTINTTGVICRCIHRLRNGFAFVFYADDGGPIVESRQAPHGIDITVLEE
jgi:hypothetical protein